MLDLFNEHLTTAQTPKHTYFFRFQNSNLAHSTDLDAAKTMATTRSPQTHPKDLLLNPILNKMKIGIRTNIENSENIKKRVFWGVWGLLAVTIVFAASRSVE